MTHGSVPPDATLEEAALVVAVSGKLALPQRHAVSGADAGVQRGLQDVASIVAGVF